MKQYLMPSYGEIMKHALTCKAIGAEVCSSVWCEFVLVKVNMNQLGVILYLNMYVCKFEPIQHVFRQKAFCKESILFHSYTLFYSLQRGQGIFIAINYTHVFSGDPKYLQTTYKLTPVLDPYASKIDLHETVDGWFVPSMPDLNQRNPHVMKYLIQNSEWWIETVGIDGIRMDTHPYADRDGMALWLKTLDNEYPNFNTVGETWVSEPAYTAAWQKDSKLSEKNSYLKTVMDFAFHERINQAKNEDSRNGWGGMNRIYNVLCYDYLYANPKNVMAFIENHDTDRFLGEGQDTLALKQALALLLTINRTPQLYYGTEVLMNGTKAKTDGYVRQNFPGGWAGDTNNAFTEEGRTKAQNDIFHWTSRLLHWRKGNEVITKGSQTQFCTYNGIYVIARQYNGKNVMTIINGQKEAGELNVKRYAEIIGNAEKATDVTTGCNVAINQNIKLRPRQTMVLEF